MNYDGLEDLIMSNDKHLSKFLEAKWKLLCLLSFKYFSPHAIWGISTGTLPSFSWGMFGHVSWSDQSRASENIDGLEGNLFSMPVCGHVMCNLII